MAKLDGKIAKVTGGSSGIGEGQVQLFVEEGAKVIIADLNPPSDEMLADLGGNAKFVQLDVGDEASWTKLLEQVETVFRTPTILVNTAGIFMRSRSLKLVQRIWTCTTV